MMRLLLVALVAATLVPACRLVRGGDRPAPRPAAVLHVSNDNWLDVRVLAVQEGSRIPLAQVSTGQSAVVRVPEQVLGPGSVVLEADPIGTTAVFRTSRIFITGTGVTHIELRVSNALDQSTFSVWVEDADDGA